MKHLLTGIGALLVSLAVTAHAGPPVCDGGMQVRVNQGGLSFVIDQVKPLLPSSLDIPPTHVDDWPVSNTKIDVAGGPVSITLHQLLAQMDSGALRIQGKADVVGGSGVDVDYKYVPGVSNCQADVQLRNLSLDVAVELGSQAGRLQAKVTLVNISFDNDNTVVSLKGCALGTVLTGVVSFVRKYFMDTAMSLVEKIAKEKIGALAADKLGETIEITKEVKGFVFTGRLDELRTDDAGVSVALGVGVGLAQPATPPCLAGANLTPPAACVGVPVQLSSQVDAMFGAGLSEAMLNQALHAVWSGGMLCLSSADPKLATMAQGLGKLSSALGQPQGTQLGFALRMLDPPRVRMSLQQGLELRLSKVMLKLTLTPPTGPAGEVIVNASLTVGGIPWINPSGNVLSLDLRTVNVGQLELTGKDGQPAPIQLDPARLQRFIATVAMPVLRERLGEMPLSASVINLQSVLADLNGFQGKLGLVELKSVQVKDGYLAAYIDGHILEPSSDTSPPETQLVESPGAAVGPQVLRLTVSGQDNRTPSSLLQYRARVDGGQWTEARYGGRIDVTVNGGTHVVEVAAVDHDGNEDPTPLQLPVTVDDVMPQLVITSRPDSLVEDDTVEVEFAGRDDRTAPEQLKYTAELYRVPDGGGMPELVQSVDVPAVERAVTMADLPDGVYKIRVIVADGVGNVTSQDVGFVVATEGGCSVSGSPQAMLPTLLVLLALAVFRRRAR